MEVKGKTIKELMENFLKEINKKVKTEGNSEKFSTKFEVKGKYVEECIQKFAEKILNYFSRKNAVFENFELEISVDKKWCFSFSLEGKIFEKIESKISEIKIEKLEESVEGWKLNFSVN